ncbi:UPF0187-domain-containing protein [Cylindrobasidium torrendii FP15055 ss-10]|uniref:UPF0187-domain-containing protein n=1 Tax=Cylindrobasidium torrendii FP15055 ss-10 TaxID=1314674 RepID=A0A0D7B4U3_9AGAR|nr:UPF0187-domain-containing protein [Cylindrobasidium torrendii FP15055 ss-10]
MPGIAFTNGHSPTKAQRSLTARHTLLPAIKPSGTFVGAEDAPSYNLVTWTFGRGSVIWRIWPAVLFHTLFAALIVFLEMQGYVHLAIPNVMLTVLGVVIGFVISYRAISGYERYWMGRTCWSDVIKNIRTMSRLIWFHVPPTVTPRTSAELESGKLARSKEELLKVMAEKRTALDLAEGFCVALKHHVRSEDGIYYQDLYDLIRPLHNHAHTEDHRASAQFTALPPGRAHRITSNPALRKTSKPANPPRAESSFHAHVIPPINAYGTFVPPQHTSSSGSSSSVSSTTPLQAATQANPNGNGVMSQVNEDLVPFSSFFTKILAIFKRKSKDEDDETLPNFGVGSKNPYAATSSQRKWRGPVHPRLGGSHKTHPVLASTAEENLPLEILRVLSEWMSVLEARGSVPGTSLGGMLGTLAGLEDSLSALERILTTPLPFVYSVHIRHTVWLYLFFLPFQLVGDFGWYAVPGVCIASFIYLGFLAAGEEIEQPFGYDENDLDLDLFCQAIVHSELQKLKTSPCLNAYLEPAVPMSIDTDVGGSDSDSDEEEATPVQTRRVTSPTSSTVY